MCDLYKVSVYLKLATCCNQLPLESKMDEMYNFYAEKCSHLGPTNESWRKPYRFHSICPSACPSIFFYVQWLSHFSMNFFHISYMHHLHWCLGWLLRISKMADLAVGRGLTLSHVTLTLRTLKQGHFENMLEKGEDTGYSFMEIFSNCCNMTFYICKFS